MDRVFIEDLEVDTVVGVFDWERGVRQTVVLNIQMSADIAAAARTDSIDDALNYKAVAERLAAFVGASSFHLVETLAQRCAEIVLDEFDVAWLQLRVDKPGAVAGAKSVGVVIERGRSP